MMGNIVIIGHEPLTKNIKRLYYIDELKLLGYSVSYLDLSFLIYKKQVNFKDSLQEEFISKIESYSQFKEKLSHYNRQSIFIIEIPYLFKNRKIYQAISYYCNHMICIDQYANTTLSESKGNYWKKIKNPLYFCAAAKRKLERMSLKLYSRWFRLREPEKKFSSSKIDPQVTDYINHPDYEEYMETLNAKMQPTGVNLPYILFIDNYFPYHPDFELRSGVDLSSADVAYHRSLNQYFSYLENRYHMPVIIAAHPKAEYNESIFEGRRIIKYQTANLVSSANRVIMHASNSISFVLLGNKPFVMISTNGYEKINFLYERMKQLAKELDHPIHNIDKDILDTICFQNCRPDIRDKYIYTYLTASSTQYRKNIDILKGYFQSIMKLDDSSLAHKEEDL